MKLTHAAAINLHNELNITVRVLFCIFRNYCRRKEQPKAEELSPKEEEPPRSKSTRSRGGTTVKRTKLNKAKNEDKRPPKKIIHKHVHTNAIWYCFAYPCTFTAFNDGQLS
eukprot:442134_1